MAVKNFERVDRLAEVNAQIAALQDEATDLKAQIVLTGFPVTETEKYRCVVSMVDETKVVDYKAVVTALKVAPELLAKFQKTRAGYAKVALYDL
jgi:hypothetical protein